MKRAFTCAALLLTAGAGWAACFDDASWQALQLESRRQPALLYVWSPRMVLSAVHADKVRAAAQKEGLRLVPVHDHRVPADEVAHAVDRLKQQVPAAADALAGSLPLCSARLQEQDAYRHFPTAWVVHHGASHAAPLVAAMPAEFWRQGIRLRMAEAERNAHAKVPGH